MARTRPNFDDLMEISTRGELRAAVLDVRGRLSIPQAQQIASRAQTLEPCLQTLRLGIIHTYTSDLLDPWLTMAAALQGLDLQVHHAAYGLALQEAREDSELVKLRPDITLLLLQREDLHPGLGHPVARYDLDAQNGLRKAVLERLTQILDRFRAFPIGQLVLTLLPSLASPALGIYDAQAENSENTWWALLKADIGRYMRDSMQSSTFFDLDDVVQQVGRGAFFDPRFWYSTRFPFTAEGAREISRRVVNIGVALKFPKAKVLVLDADNTLWGGIVGEDGMEGIALGPEYPGNVYVDFQRRLLAYQRRGLVLALCSKNNPADVDLVLKEHPHQILRDEHFAARRVNWLPKPDNLISLAEELNLGLDSLIFVDDSDHECAIVRHHLPQVEVIQVPSRPSEIPSSLEHVARLEVLSLTAEDLVKTELYAQERRRRELVESIDRVGGGIDDYLSQLQMKMQVSLNRLGHVVRLSQLTQKTNQFNLTTRRYNEHEMRQLMLDPKWLVADFSLSDTFGDSGIVGLALFRIIGPESAELDNLLMSCRVIGREAESAFLHALLRHLAQQGVTDIAANYIPTRKNDLAKDFLTLQGFDKVNECFKRDLSKHPPKLESLFPISVEWVKATAA